MTNLRRLFSPSLLAAMTIVVASVFLPSLSQAQSPCTGSTAQGTSCPSPFTTTVQAGTTATWMLDISPATAQFPCITLAQSPTKLPSGVAYRMCGQNNQVTVDFGTGFVSMQGPPGQNGTNGSNGAPGQAATIQVGTVSTLPAGSKATVTNAGSAQAAVFNFGIPAGQNGSSTMPKSCTITFVWNNPQKTKATGTFSGCQQ
jgi:hypothetical protein